MKSFNEEAKAVFKDIGVVFVEQDLKRVMDELSKAYKSAVEDCAMEADRIKSHSTNHENRSHTIHCYYSDVGDAIRKLRKPERMA